MADVQTQPTPQAQPIVTDENRLLAIVVYGLYIAALISVGVAGIAGVIVAYIKKSEAKGTIWESHFDNQINAFWVWFVLFLIGIPGILALGLGFILIGFAFLFFLYRAIKGLILALENKPYA
jgi:uncharacterized membrane protein